MTVEIPIKSSIIDIYLHGINWNCEKSEMLNNNSDIFNREKNVVFTKTS